jgi:hypothetical protein
MRVFAFVLVVAGLALVATARFAFHR